MPVYNAFGTLIESPPRPPCMGGRRLIVCLTGMPGAGKSTIAEGLLRRGGHTVVNMGDAVRAEATRRGLEPTAPNLGALMVELRRRGGPGAVALLVVPAIRAAPPGHTVVVDGVRSNDEVEHFREIGRVRILSVHASADTRFRLLGRRGRSDDPRDREKFDERDSRELGVGISGSIAMADESISNNAGAPALLVDRAASIIAGWAAPGAGEEAAGKGEDGA